MPLRETLKKIGESFQERKHEKPQESISHHEKASKVTSTVDTSTPLVVDTAIVHETHVREKLEEVQPVIHREIIEPEIHRVIEPIDEHQIKQTIHTDKNLNAIVKDTVVESLSNNIINQLDTPLDISTVDVKNLNKVIEKPPIIIEHHVKKIIEEIQPIIHRTIEEPEIIHENLDIYETVVRAPILVEETKKVAHVEFSPTAKLEEMTLKEKHEESSKITYVETKKMESKKST